MKIGLIRATSILKVGLRAILRNPMRSALTILGIVIGVGCVIAMGAVGSGASQSIQSNISSLGANFIMVYPGAVTQGGARVFASRPSLTPDDAAAIKAECASVAYVSPGVRMAAPIVAGEYNWSTEVNGADVDWPYIRAWNLDRGVFFSEAEVRAGTKVAVLGDSVADNLFPGDDPLGAIIRIRNVPFKVVGVLERKGGSTMGQDQDDQVVVPYTTLMKRVLGRDRLNLIQVTARSPDRIGEAMQEIGTLLRQRHRIARGEDDDFMMRSQEEIAATAQETTRTLSLLLGSVAAISLLVGGIGIMNIMLVSVSERTREIGIRMAVGAKARHVLGQFLLEAIVLSIVGGAIGVALGVAASRLIAAIAGWPVAVTVPSVAVAFGFAAFVGVFFGWYPARKAARLDPIEALRHE
ncbi:MAG TPA: ABC transporter permease [Candidatus Polarisedimenticolia bacterium]|jgi:putative ABC transport system permease protein|nr:ABC transporter permease [Candidatus Polarisedimenticolia bacterium]